VVFFSPNGETLVSVAALEEADIEKIVVPIRKRVWTLYGVIVGDLMAWVCVVLSVFVYLPLAYLPLSLFEKLDGNDLFQKVVPEFKRLI